MGAKDAIKPAWWVVVEGSVVPSQAHRGSTAKYVYLGVFRCAQKIVHMKAERCIPVSVLDVMQ